MTVAIWFEQLVCDGISADYTELTRLGRVTRPRMTQIMKLLNLAPDNQEAIVFLPRVERGKDPVTERELRDVVRKLVWGRQREVWAVDRWRSNLAVNPLRRADSQ